MRRAHHFRAEKNRTKYDRSLLIHESPFFIVSDNNLLISRPPRKVNNDAMRLRQSKCILVNRGEDDNVRRQ